MKIVIINSFLLLLLLCCCSCKENKEHDIEESLVNDKTSESLVDYASSDISFKEEFLKLPIKNVPITVTNTKEEKTNLTINAKALQLPAIYEYWYQKVYNYQLISGYRLKLSKDFYTAVLKIRIGENDQEHRLINYDLDGKVISSIRVALFSDGEFEYTSTKSKINQDEITQTHQFVVKNHDEKEETLNIVKIEPDGNLIESSEKEIICNLVANKLKIDDLKRIQDLEAFKLHPNNPYEAIVVIPEIVEGSLEEEYFSLNSHIAIVDLSTKTITHRYFESSKTNNWVSDAIRIDGISIDKKLYKVNEITNAFGVSVDYFGSSRVNPYHQHTLSLFIKENGQLKNILHNYNFEKNTGEWNGACEGEFFDEKTEFIFTNDQTNDYFNIIVKKTQTKTTNSETEIGDCDYNEEIKRDTSVLKFDGQLYK